MRFPQLSAMPASSVREWLDHELELRGIDAVIYTRYILSILQQDNYNLEPQERDLFPTCGKRKEYPPRKGKGKGKQKVSKMKFTDCEEMKKIAAVECLMSASEQKCGIEELVDELCSRLKSIQCEVGCGTDTICKPVTVQSALLPEASIILDSPEEQAEKYYAAFPALSIKPEGVNLEAINVKYTSQCNSFWDGKKLLFSASKDQESGSSSENDEQPSCYQTASSDPEIAGTTNTSGSSTSELAVEPEKCTPPECKVVKHASKPHPYQHHYHHHHHHHYHHYHHLYSKSLKSGRENSSGKPSFIVPKCKYRILKQRVPFFKGKSPFRAPDLKLKHLSNTDVKSTLKSSCSHSFHLKKVEDNEVAYDSSFEDGDLDESFLKHGPINCLAEKCTLEDRSSDISESFADDSFSDVATVQSPDEDLIDVLKDENSGTTQDKQKKTICSADDKEILQKLEAKFNESLAAIWRKQDINDSSFDKLSQMLETAFKTSLSVWVTNLRKSNAEDSFFSGVILGTDEQAYWQTSAITIHSDSTETEIKESNDNPRNKLLEDKAPYSEDNQIMVKNLGSLWYTQDDSYANNFCDVQQSTQKTTEDIGRIWQCETEKHNFIKGGVYGFENCKEGRTEEIMLPTSVDLLEMDRVELRINTSSPGFDSDIDAFLHDQGSSSLEQEDVAEEDMKLIWEVLGAIGRSNNTASCVQNSNIEIPATFANESSDPGLDTEPVSATDEIQCGSSWEQVDQFDEWHVEKKSIEKSWGCSTFPLHTTAETTSPFKRLSVLWNEADIDQVNEVCLSLRETDNVSGIATAFRWGGAESYHQSLWDIWKDVRDDKNALDGDNNVMNELNVLSNSNNDEHLNMTRSYDSYLNKEVVEGGAKLECLSRTHDHVHHSDPILFGKQSILTYHKGESLFVEVKRQPNSDTLKNSTTKLFLSLNDSSASLRSNSSDHSNATISHLSTAFNSIMVGYTTTSESDKKETLEGADDGIMEEENLLTSPKTHFRPIRQLSCDSDETTSSGDIAEPVNESERNLQDSVDDNYTAVQPVNDNCSESPSLQSASIFTQEDNGILRLSSESIDGEKKSHLYMLYKGQEVSKRQKHVMSAFIPKFKLRSDLEKFCQTEDIGTLPEHATNNTLFSKKCSSSVCIMESGCLTESNEIEESYKVTNSDCGEASLMASDTVLKIYSTMSRFESVTPRSEDDVNAVDDDDDDDPSYSSEGLSSGIATVAFEIGKINARSFKEFDTVSGSVWSAADDDDDDDDDNNSSEENDDPWPPPQSDFSVMNDIDEQDFWAITKQQERVETNELITLKEEIKKEEEQLFEDINQMRELDLHNEWDENDEFAGMEMHNILRSSEDKKLKWPVYQEVSLDCQEDEDCPELEMINSGQYETVPTWNEEVDEYAEEPLVRDGASSVCLDYSLFKRRDKTGASDTSHCLPTIPTSKVIYSSDLEEEWMKQGRPFDIQVPKRSHVKAKIKLYRRPCTFFMDGSCRRTDCKFSHDLASITCRFWEEGSCFKGITCPFLHGYPRKPSPLHKTNKPRDFHLESESDFPSLSKSADSTSSGSWMASNVSTKRKKKRNRPRHHSTSVADNDGEKCKSVNSVDA